MKNFYYFIYLSLTFTASHALYSMEPTRPSLSIGSEEWLKEQAEILRKNVIERGIINMYIDPAKAHSIQAASPSIGIEDLFSKLQPSIELTKAFTHITPSKVWVIGTRGPDALLLLYNQMGQLDTSFFNPQKTDHYLMPGVMTINSVMLGIDPSTIKSITITNIEEDSTTKTVNGTLQITLNPPHNQTITRYFTLS